MDGLEVLDDLKVLNINMVHFIIMQVDLTLEELKKEKAGGDSHPFLVAKNIMRLNRQFNKRDSSSHFKGQQRS